MAWEHTKISNGETELFCNAYITDKTAMNIICVHTPIITTLALQKAYEPFEKYGVNLFAIDFSGTGKSISEERLSRASFVKDLDSVVAYIADNYSSNIHLYGATGIGGMFAQYYATTSKKIKSLAQFNCINYKQTAGMGYPLPLATIMHFFLKLLPNVTIPYNPPKYNGPRQEEDNGFYRDMQEKYPAFKGVSTKFLEIVLSFFVAKDSAAKNSVAIPTLVYKIPHDRFMTPQFFDDYYASLACKKKLVEIKNGIHNSYYFDNEQFCKHAYEWFAEHSG